MSCVSVYFTESSPKTVYILKKSDSKSPAQNKYVLKTVLGAKLLPQKTMYQQQKPTDKVNRPKPLERVWGNDYETLQALDKSYMDSLSLYKKTPLQDNVKRRFLTPVEHDEGIFTPNVDLSDGDISIDSGTGNSLDSDDDVKHKPQLNKKMSTMYRHKPRGTVRAQLADAKISSSPEDKKPVGTKVSRLPRLIKKPMELTPPKPRFLSVESPARSKSSPESIESRPIITKPQVNKPPNRNTLHMRKKVQPLPIKRQQPQNKPMTEAHPLAPINKLPLNKVVERKLPLGKVPKSIKAPTILPRKQRLRIIESPSDDDIDEIFKQTTSQRTLPPRASLRVGLQPPRAKRKYGIQPSLAKIK